MLQLLELNVTQHALEDASVHSMAAWLEKFYGSVPSLRQRYIVRNDKALFLSSQFDVLYLHSQKYGTVANFWFVLSFAELLRVLSLVPFALTCWYKSDDIKHTRLKMRASATRRARHL